MGTMRAAGASAGWRGNPIGGTPGASATGGVGGAMGRNEEGVNSRALGLRVNSRALGLSVSLEDEEDAEDEAEVEGDELVS